LGTIFEILFQFVLIFPGAFFRWIIAGRRRKYSDYLDSSPEINILVSILVFAFLIAMLKWIFF
jgi:hypothetical protein